MKNLKELDILLEKASPELRNKVNEILSDAGNIMITERQLLAKNRELKMEWYDAFLRKSRVINNFQNKNVFMRIWLAIRNQM